MSFSKIVFHDLAAISSEVTCPNKHRIEGAQIALWPEERANSWSNHAKNRCNRYKSVVSTVE